MASTTIISGYFFYDNSNVPVTMQRAYRYSLTHSTTPPSADYQPKDSTHMSTSVGKLKPYYVVNCHESISLRENPSISSKLLNDIPLDSPVSYVEASRDGFAKIIYNGTTGYALQAYLSNNSADIRKSDNNSSNVRNNGTATQ